MSIKPEYFDYLRHIGRSVTMRQLHEHPAWSDAVAIRHDVDHDLDLALDMAHCEHERGIHATYFLLHTSDYWRDDRFLVKCRQLEAYGHEVGLHLNVLTEWMHGACDDIGRRLRDLLEPLREAGITVVGTSAHGDRACYEHGLVNYWIWRELRPRDPAHTEHGLSAEGVAADDPKWQVSYPRDHALQRPDGARLALWNCSLAEHGLVYDAIHVSADRYWTDTGGDWTRSDDPLEADLSTGRHQILIHPHWWRGPKRLHFVLSTARCGSKWLANFVDRATSCRGLHEWTLNHRRDAEAMVADKRTNSDYVGLINDRPTATQLIRQAASHFRTLPGDVLEANVYLEPFAAALNALGDDVTLIHLHRNGRDVVRSLLNRNWYETPEDHKHRTVPVENWQELTQFERACWYYRFTNESLMPFATKRIRFESMVTDLSYLTEQLASLGIVVHPLLAAEEFPKRINANPSSRHPPYDDWPQDYRRTFERICGPVQRALGYATDEVLAPEPAAPVSRRTGGRGATTLLEIDLTRHKLKAVSAVHVTCRQDEAGLHIHTDASGVSSAHLLLAVGKWSAVDRKHGFACDSWSYYVCRLTTEMPAGMAIRLFALWYDDEGSRLSRDHVATLRPDTPITACSFSPASGASHFALALHFGDQAPDAVLTLCSISLRAIPLGQQYKAALAEGSPVA